MNLEPMSPPGIAATESNTIRGLLISAAGLLLPGLLLKFHVTPADVKDYVEGAQYLITGAGLIWAAWSRSHSNTPLPPITSVTKG